MASKKLYFTGYADNLKVTAVTATGNPERYVRMLHKYLAPAIFANEEVIKASIESKPLFEITLVPRTEEHGNKDILSAEVQLFGDQIREVVETAHNISWALDGAPVTFAWNLDKITVTKDQSPSKIISDYLHGRQTAMEERLRVRAAAETKPTTPGEQVSPGSTAQPGSPAGGPTS